MDCKLTGELIYKLRKEKKLTQMEVANSLGISDKAVSKWERGLACPDVVLLNELSQLFNVNLNKLLLGELTPNKYNSGNMKSVDFYVCDNCNNIMFGLNDVELYCCGRKIVKLEVKSIDELHSIKYDVIENEYFIQMNHSMTKEHYINFVAYVVEGGVTILKLYPEQNMEIRIPKYYKLDLYLCCSADGLFKIKM